MKLTTSPSVRLCVRVLLCVFGVCLTEVEVETEQVTEQHRGQQPQSDGDRSQSRNHCCCWGERSDRQEDQPHRRLIHHWHTHTHKHTNPLRPSSISSCVQAFRDSLSAFIFSNVGCPICSTTGNINRPTIAFTEINTVEYSPSPSLSLSPSLCLFRSPQITGAFYMDLFLYGASVTQILHAATPQNTKLEVWWAMVCVTQIRKMPLHLGWCRWRLQIHERWIVFKFRTE